MFVLAGIEEVDEEDEEDEYPIKMNIFVLGAPPSSRSLLNNGSCSSEQL